MKLEIETVATTNTIKDRDVVCMRAIGDKRKSDDLHKQNNEKPPNPLLRNSEKTRDNRMTDDRCARAGPTVANPECRTGVTTSKKKRNFFAGYFPAFCCTSHIYHHHLFLSLRKITFNLVIGDSFIISAPSRYCCYMLSGR